MALPYEKFLIYRSLRGDNCDQINSWLQRFCLPLIDYTEHANIESKVKALCIPRGYKTLYRKGNKATVPESAMEYLRFHKLDELFAFDEQLQGYLKDEVNGAMEGAFLIHHSPFVRLAVNVLLFHKKSKQKIIDLILAGHGYELTEDSLNVYEEFFFDFKKMSPECWNNYLGSMMSKEREIMYAALTNKLDDIVYLLKIPSSIEYVDFLKSAMNTAHYKFNYYSSLNTSSGDKNARSWASTGINSGERYEKFKNSDNTDIFKQFQMEFDHQDINIPVATPEIAASVKMDDRKQEDSLLEAASSDFNKVLPEDPENF